MNPKKKHFNGVVRTHPRTLDEPLRKKQSTLWFVNSMSDLFHKGVPFEFVAAVFGVMAATPHHQYQVLTKRPERMGEFFRWLDRQGGTPVEECLRFTTGEGGPVGLQAAPTWPLPNVWLGTSVEDERVADRAEALREVPAQVRFLSCEPLIGPLDLESKLDGMHWVIVGGESGHGARPMDIEWAEAIQDACDRAGVAFFFKQTGAVLAREWGLSSKKGSKATEWPSEHRHLGERAFPPVA
ncbi:MAG: DUF5131 family protein [Myxococcota bacterium]